MLGFLQKRPERGVVFDKGSDGKYRWRVVVVLDKHRHEGSLDAGGHRTVFLDQVQDGYFSVKECYRDAAAEIARWCPLNKVEWYMEILGRLVKVERMPDGSIAARSSGIDVDASNA